MKSKALFFFAIALLGVGALLFTGCVGLPGIGGGATTTEAATTTAPLTTTEPSATTTAPVTTAPVTTAPAATEDNFIALPDPILTTKGQYLTLYFRSLVQLGEGESLVVTGEDGRGTQYSDRWEYAPDKVETFTLTFELMKEGEAVKTEYFTVDVKAGSTGELNVLVLGDSTVNAGTITQTMLSLAETYNRDLNLYGTRGGSGNLHEGRGGWTAKSYWTTAATDVYTNAFYDSSVGHFSFEYYMEQNGYSNVDLDVVVIQLGINDIFGLTTPERVESGIAEYIEYMERIIDNIHDYDRTIKIVLHPVIPCTANEEEFRRVYPTSAQTIEGYLSNMQKVNMALIEAFGEEKRIYISPYHAALDSVANQPSDVHPSYSGYTQLGRMTYNFITAVTSR